MNHTDRVIILVVALAALLPAQDTHPRTDLVSQMAAASRMNSVGGALLVTGIGLDVLGPVVASQGIKRLWQYYEARNSADDSQYSGAPAGTELLVMGGSALAVGVPLTIVGASLKSKSKRQLARLEQLLSLRVCPNGITLSLTIR